MALSWNEIKDLLFAHCQQLEGLYVGLWPVTILAFAIAIRQRRKDSK